MLSFFFFGLLEFESHCVDEVVSDQFFGCKFNVSSFPVSSVLTQSLTVRLV